MAPSPYTGLAPVDWSAKTAELVATYPLMSTDMVDVTLHAWQVIFSSTIGAFRIGVEIFPKPQIMGFFLHELIPLELARRFPGVWRADRTKAEKDLVYHPDPTFSAEIKTSSHPSRIFGNRSFAQAGTGNRRTKQKSGYYIAVNFEPFVFNPAGEPDTSKRPEILKIRFGWLDHSDWVGQQAQTGQQSALSSAVENGKLATIYQR